MGQEVEEADAVNEKTIQHMEDKLKDQMNAKKFQNQMEEDEKKELAEVTEMDAVNEESKALLEGQLKNKLIKHKVDNDAEKKEQEELKKLKEADNVNEKTKAALEKAMQKDKESKEEEVASAEITASSPAPSATKKN